LNVCLDLREFYSNINKNKQEVSINVGGYQAVILLGGNIGDVRKSFEMVAEALISFGEIERKSSIYQTEAWGMENADAFLNQVLQFKTNENPEKLLQKLLDIEEQLGRKRSNTGAYLARNIDIDILFIDSLILKMPKLEIPHPRLHLRRFTLEPLVEIIPNYIHPVLKRTMVELHLNLKDNLKVERLDG
tara:strand:- start:100 stop:666 length:567 start_codon:yes stop_codon:yes gene_type:complete